MIQDEMTELNPPAMALQPQRTERLGFTASLLPLTEPRETCVHRSPFQLGQPRQDRKTDNSASCYLTLWTLTFQTVQTPHTTRHRASHWHQKMRRNSFAIFCTKPRKCLLICDLHVSSIPGKNPTGKKNWLSDFRSDSNTQKETYREAGDVRR